MSKLLGRRALVTAGAQGIGLAISRRLLHAGCDLVVHYRSTGASARRTSAVIDRVLAAYYGGRDDAFWDRPATWPGRQRTVDGV